MNAIELIIQAAIVFLFLIFIWAGFTKQTVSEVLGKIKSWFTGESKDDEDEPVLGGIMR